MVSSMGFVSGIQDGPASQTSYIPTCTKPGEMGWMLPPL